jgi:hypothetical protein
MAVDAAVDSLAELARRRERLDIEANLSVSIDGRVFAVSSEDDRVVVHAPSVRACLALLSQQSGRLVELADLLAAAGVTVEVVTGEATLAIVGADANPGPLTARLSDSAELCVSGALAGVLRLR